MIVALSLMVALATPDMGGGQDADDLSTQAQAAIAARSPARLAALVSTISRSGTRSSMTADEVVSALSGCIFDARRPSPGREGLTYLYYSCPDRAKAATGCLTGDLILGVDANDLSLHFSEAVRYDGPDCGPPAAPPAGDS